MIDIHVHSKQLAKDKLEFLRYQANEALTNGDTNAYKETVRQINEVQKEIIEYGFKEDKDPGRQNAGEGTGEQEDYSVWYSSARSESNEAADRNCN